jgi:hypothetical protein
MSIEERSVEKPAHQRGTEPQQDATGALAGRAATISPEAGKHDEASPGAEADKRAAKDR